MTNWYVHMVTKIKIYYKNQWETDCHNLIKIVYEHIVSTQWTVDRRRSQPSFHSHNTHTHTHT